MFIQHVYIVSYAIFSCCMFGLSLVFIITFAVVSRAFWKKNKGMSFGSMKVLSFSNYRISKFLILSYQVVHSERESTCARTLTSTPNLIEKRARGEIFALTDQVLSDHELQ